MQTVDAHGEKVQAMFDRIAGGYDRANRLMSLWTDVGWRRRAVAGLLPHDGGDAPRVLDLCAGTLDSSLEIHRQFPHAHVVAGDFAVRMLEHGKRKLRGAAAEHIETRPMDAHRLPLPDADVDAIFCAFGIRNLSDLHQATLEQARVLRPGGRLVVLEFFRPTTAFTRTFHAVMGRSVLPVVGGLATGDFAAYTYLPRSISTFDTVERYGDRLRAAGFGDVQVQPLTRGVAAVVRATKLGVQEVA
jgi:demethylmenaquinone methyltransferase/2-methoxy-6-polyprenyl-1,4-benzoquinol methylase